MRLQNKAKTWEEFLTMVSRGYIDISFLIISVDGDSPENHVVEFKIGDFQYRWDGDDFQLVSSPVDKDLVLKVLRAFAPPGRDG